MKDGLRSADVTCKKLDKMTKKMQIIVYWALLWSIRECRSKTINAGFMREADPATANE